MEEIHRVQFVKVKNNNTFAIADRYDGVPYIFGAGKTETIPLDAAQHIFGFREDGDTEAMYHYMVQRHGWNTYKVPEETARANVGNIVMTKVSARLVMEPPQGVAETDAASDEAIPVKPGPGAKSLASLAASAKSGLAKAAGSE